MQTVTVANCPTTRTMAIDARDNHTYWIQKFSNGHCWMLTNLAYAGGGTNTYNDVKTLSNGTSDTAFTYTSGKYYVVPSSTSFTTAPTEPSTSTNGTGQYGYLYNFCGAMGVQATSACDSTFSTSTVNASISICPAGWRVPSHNSGHANSLNTAVNGGSTSTDAGLRTNWLGQYSGRWTIGFGGPGSAGEYYTIEQTSAGGGLAFAHGSTYFGTWNYSSGWAMAIRCLIV